VLAAECREGAVVARAPLDRGTRDLESALNATGRSVQDDRVLDRARIDDGEDGSERLGGKDVALGVVGDRRDYLQQIA